MTRLWEIIVRKNREKYCLALGAYEKTDVDPEYGGLTHWSNYVSVIDVQGTGTYNIT